jgi:hypothetical protein
MGRMSDYQINQMETPIMDKCPECDGEGSVYYEVARPQSFTRDIGYLEEVVQVCELFKFARIVRVMGKLFGFARVARCL